MITAVVAMLFAAQVAVTAPFTWQGESWCPDYDGTFDCNSIQSSFQYLNVFDPAQVEIGDNGGVRLIMSADLSKSGAFNTGSQEIFSPPVTLTERIYLACNTSGQIYNWPAFWATGTTGTWPANGEIDIMEGLHGIAQWHYHYQNAAGNHSAVGGDLSQAACGYNDYAVKWTANKLTFYFNGSSVGTVQESCSSPCKQIGVPIATDPMIVRDDYATTGGGLSQGQVNMRVASFTVS